MIVLLGILAGCDSTGAGGTTGEGDNSGDDADPAPREATLEVLYDNSVLDGQTPVDLGDILEGDDTAKTFTVRNSGTATAEFGDPKLTITGTYADEFILDTFLTADSLAPGASTTFRVIFVPTGTGALSDETVTVSIESDAANEPPTIELIFSVFVIFA